ncbi:MAG TPA: RNA polymerase sporulation sigma factor SigF [Firmicutes bacterium]|nr:RNA polymerase sporulation sigma factor SigF [Bacillota bacterium]HWR54941.1 RNA polymerase sporulation sigma factor SigF [Negativicutes bacterium]
MALADEDFRVLISRAQAGEQAAREQLVANNLNLVRSILQRFTNRGYEWDDLFQIGCIGLVKAIDRFDLNIPVKFSTYAVPMIIGEIKRFFRDDNPVKVSRPLKELAYKVHKMQSALQAEWGRDPTVQELSQKLKVPVGEIISALEAAQTPTSLYELAYHDGGDPIFLMDQIKLENPEEENFFEKFAIKEVLEKLSDKERKVIRLRFFMDKTQAEVAGIIGLSQVQVSRIEKQALLTMRKYMADTG